MDKGRKPSEGACGSLEAATLREPSAGVAGVGFTSKYPSSGWTRGPCLLEENRRPLLQQLFHIYKVGFLSQECSKIPNGLIALSCCHLAARGSGTRARSHALGWGTGLSVHGAGCSRAGPVLPGQSVRLGGVAGHAAFLYRGESF